MKLISKSEWFILERPLMEPDIDWKEHGYQIERIEKDGEIIWFGLDTNWKKENGKEWTVLGVDESIKPTLFIKGENGMGDYAEYPEGRNIWIKCEEPIYETLYKQL